MIPFVQRLIPTIVALIIGAFLLSFAPAKTIGPPWFLLVLAAAALLWVAWQPSDTVRDDMLPAVTIVLASFGLLLVSRISPVLAQKQEVWIAISLGFVIVLGPALTRFRRFASFTYVWVLASLILFALLFLFGEEVNGAKLWIRFGPVQYEPVELIKLFIVFFLAAYLGEAAEFIAKAKPLSLRANLKYLGPLLLGWGASMAILVLQHDIGMASLLVVTFATLLYAATRRLDIVIGGFAIFGVGVYWAMHHFSYIHTRIAAWQNPFADPLGAGYQPSQGYYSLAAGGVFGTGFTLGHPTFIPDVATDYIYAALSEEFGLIGAIALLIVYLALVRRILMVGTQQPDLYTKLLAIGLGATIGFQVLIIVGGVIGLFPLTGITLPFISYGGSSLVANFLLVAIVWAMSARPRAGRA